MLSPSDFGPDHRALPRIFANPRESQLAEITQLLFRSDTEAREIIAEFHLMIRRKTK
jgi:hypothetical protein